MALTDAQKRALAKYEREKVKNIRVRFYPKDAELYEFVKAQENMNGLVLQLLRAELDRAKADGEWPKE